VVADHLAGEVADGLGLGDLQRLLGGMKATGVGPREQGTYVLDF
jgi:hypothetical protein